ncbi:MAG: HAD-IC family P-type ATPase [Bacilli bacterium]|nr:HAD-IC family P-type ATPase [Bacilli bacterium]
MLFRRKPSDLEKLIESAPEYKPTYNKGLTDEQVLNRTVSDLTNKQNKTVTKSYFEIIFKNVFTTLNILLFVVAGFMIYLVAAEGKPVTRLFFLGILVLNIGISLFQDVKARKLVGKLSLLSSPKATVVRNGKEIEIPFNEIVLSDIIVVKAGNTIPSDAVIVHGEIRINESLLSGETEDVKKGINEKIYAESVVVAGTAYARVIKMGNANYASKLQEKARAFSRPKSEILASLTTIIRIISITAIAIGVAEIVTYALTGLDFPTAVDKIASSVVGMIPIGMYLMTSITLTVGVIILSRHRILVRELYSIEMLARVNMICLDKTGTLTDGNMKVKELVPIKVYRPETLENIISTLLYITKDDNLTAKALKSRYPIKPIEGKFATIPFSSETKYSAASFKGHTYAIGAYGFLKTVNNKMIQKAVKYYEEGGHRVLVIAESDSNIKNDKLPKDMRAIGLVVLNESIKPDAKNNIDWFQSSDVGVRVISGDSVLSLKNIAKEVGIKDFNKAISLEGLTDDEVKKAAHEKVIFGRVTPEQKKIIITELRHMGNTVAMVGDGVNDLLALKSADCSIAMASGSDAAKAASHLVSMDSNFSSLPKVVEEGRRVINNLQRVCSIFLVKTIYTIFMSTLFLILSWVGVGNGYPFVTNHLLVWELLTIGIAPFFVALEPNKERIKGGFIKNIIREALPGALAQLLVTLPIISAGIISPVLFPMDGVIAMCVIDLSIMSLVIFLHVCLPLNKYRSLVLFGTFLVMGAFFVADGLIATFTSSDILNIDYLSI